LHNRLNLTDDPYISAGETLVQALDTGTLKLTLTESRENNKE